MRKLVLAVVAALGVLGSGARAEAQVLVYGAVQDTSTYLPLRSVEIIFAGPENRSVLTNADGFYSIILLDGTYTITPAEDGYTFKPAQQQLTLDIDVFPYGRELNFRGTPIPAPPAPIPPAPANLRALRVKRTTCTLVWQDLSANETGFSVEQETTVRGVWISLGTLPANSTGARITRLRRRTAYRFRVRAFNEYGASGTTNELTVTTRR